MGGVEVVEEDVVLYVRSSRAKGSNGGYLVAQRPKTKHAQSRSGASEDQSFFNALRPACDVATTTRTRREINWHADSTRNQ